MSVEQIEVRPVTGHTGAEIHGADLSKPLADASVAKIRAGLLKWKVVFFRDQHITPEQQVAFARRFGQLTPAHPLRESIDGHPEVLPDRTGASFEEEYGGKQYRRDINGWHTDVTAVINPPTGSILRGEHAVANALADRVGREVSSAESITYALGVLGSPRFARSTSTRSSSTTPAFPGPTMRTRSSAHSRSAVPSSMRSGGPSRPDARDAGRRRRSRRAFFARSSPVRFASEADYGRGPRAVRGHFSRVAKSRQIAWS